MFSMLTATAKRVQSVGTVTIPGGTSFSPGILSFYLLYGINILINISIPYFFQNITIYSIFFFSTYFYQLEANYFTVL